MILSKYLLAIAAGLIAHQTNPIFEDLERDQFAAWYRLGRYSVGMIAALPTMLLMLPREWRRRVAEAFFSNGVLFGYGVAIGYVIDKLMKERKHERTK